MDLVTYLIGFAAKEDQREDDALVRFNEVIQRFPSSPLYGDAWMMVGEHFFAAAEWPKAMEAYRHIPDDAATSDLATFKIAWCEWKLGNTIQAAKDFKRVLDKAVAAERTGTEAQRRRSASLRDEALEYLVVVFTEDRSITPKEVFDFLVSIDGEQYSRDVMVKVAESYAAPGRVGAQQRRLPVPDQDGSGIDQGRRLPAQHHRELEQRARRRPRPGGDQASCSRATARTARGPRRSATARRSPARSTPPRTWCGSPRPTSTARPSAARRG